MHYCLGKLFYSFILYSKRETLNRLILSPIFRKVIYCNIVGSLRFGVGSLGVRGWKFIKLNNIFIKSIR